MKTHELFMRQALELAKNGEGFVSPNPLVGAILTINDRVISTGYHKGPGLPHAEAMAIHEAQESVEGSTLYCNLEPCCHTNKRTPPCTDLIIKSKISKVVIAALDPNPLVSGKGVERLKEAGIEVVLGPLGAEARELNRVFYKVMETGMPYMHLKWAQTLDGKMVSHLGDSKWISDVQAREEVHRLRFAYDSVMIGRITMEKDDPELSIRLIDGKGKTPKRIVVGELEKMNLNSRILTNKAEQTIVIGPSTSAKKLELIQSRGVKLLDSKNKSLKECLKELTGLGIQSCLVEGGPKLLTSLIEAKLFDRLTIYLCPVILGNGYSFYENPNRQMSEAIRIQQMKVSKLGEQVVLTLNQQDII
jgi:diaminohydroxyphosphoribosylaminopyrimidine deaminase / 5-amino-6-(5-phosphoribosylamino)uracil reductase